MSRRNRIEAGGQRHDSGCGEARRTSARHYAIQRGAPGVRDMENTSNDAASHIPESPNPLCCGRRTGRRRRRSPRQHFSRESSRYALFLPACTPMLPPGNVLRPFSAAQSWHLVLRRRDVDLPWRSKHRVWISRLRFTGGCDMHRLEVDGQGWGADAAGGESVLAGGGVWRHGGRGRAAQVRHRMVRLRQPGKYFVG
jgi:hypothetical protein